MNKRLKILVSAYACSPYKGSEPGVGWGFVSELSKYHDLWVIVEEEKFRADIERYVADNPGFSKSITFHFLKKERNRKLRKIWPPSYYWYYRRWHKNALDLAKNLHKDVGFDLVHQLTMVGFREPGYLWRLGIPFVWGPIGGMGFFPWRFLSVVGVYGACYYAAYNVINYLQILFSIRPRKAAAIAGPGLIVATRENGIGAEKYWHCPDSTLISEVGLPPASPSAIDVRNASKPIKLVWVGQHTHGKALNLALEALSKIPGDIEWELHVLGAGKMSGQWKTLSWDLGIGEKCIFHGWQPRDQALQLMQEGHVMLITSLRDLTATVTIEALALGLPIICLDHCGFADVVNADCGIKIPVSTPSASILHISQAIVDLANDEGRRQALSAGAIRRAQDYSWPAKIAALNDVYHRKLSSKQDMT